MKISDIWNNARRILENSGIDNSSEDALVLLAYCWWRNADRQLSARVSYLRVQIAAGELLEDIERRTQSSFSTEEYRDLIYKRAHHIPLQILTQTAFFYRYEFCVGSGVFIPRPETEEMVIHVIENIRVLRKKDETQLKKKNEIQVPTDESSLPLRILDMCSGSGAIGITMALELPKVIVDLIEISPQAYAYMKENSDFYQSSFVSQGSAVWCESIKDACDAHLLEEREGNIDVIISNPPYLPAARPVTQKEAQYDPQVALYGGSEDGLNIPFRIIDQAIRLLRPSSGYFAMEFDPSQSRQIKEYAQRHHLKNITIHQDFTHRDRWITAYRDKSPIPHHSQAHAILSDYENKYENEDEIFSNYSSFLTSKEQLRKEEEISPKESIEGEVKARINHATCPSLQRARFYIISHSSSSFIMEGSPWKDICLSVETGNLLVVPTDTVYGIACCAYNATAIERLYQAKHRPYNKALPLAMTMEQLDGMIKGKNCALWNPFLQLSPLLQKLAYRFLPGALTLIARSDGEDRLHKREGLYKNLPIKNIFYKNTNNRIFTNNISSLHMSQYESGYLKTVSYDSTFLETYFSKNQSSVNCPCRDTQKEETNFPITQAIRVPDCPILLKLLEKTGPLACSSANLSGRESPTTVEEAYRQLGDTVDWYIDGGTSRYGRPSTIVADDGDNNIRIIREGAISRRAIYEVLELPIS